MIKTNKIKTNLKQKEGGDLKIFCDGGSRGNPGPAAIGFVVKSKQGKQIYEFCKQIGKATNNLAEYQALTESLLWLLQYQKKVKVNNVKFYLDSNLIVNQLNGKYKIKNHQLKKMVINIKKLEKQSGLLLTIKQDLFSSASNNTIQYNFIPREKNTHADYLVNQAFDKL